MNRKVVYTSIVGGFDSLTQPFVIDETFDYVCFVRKGQMSEKLIGIWTIVEIPYENDNDRILSRYPKMLPHIVLPNYDYSLWIDGNVTIRTKEIYDIVNQKICDNVIYSGLNHWSRDCAYDDAAGCVMSSKDSLKSILKTVRFLKKEKFPKHWGLFENNVIFRKHHDKQIVQFDELWWDTFLKEARRDQLIFPYCFRKVGLEKNYLLPKEYCSRNHNAFLHVKHSVQKKQLNFVERMVDGITRRIKKTIVILYSL